VSLGHGAIAELPLGSSPAVPSGGGGGGIAYVTDSAIVTNGADASAEVGTPGGTGGIVLAFAASNGTSDFTAPSGEPDWEKRAEGGTAAIHGEVWSINSAPSNSTFGVPNTFWSAIALRYTGVDANGTWVTNGQDDGFRGDRDISVTVGAGTWMLVAGFYILNADAITEGPDGWAERARYNSGSGPTLVVYDRLVTPAGSTTYTPTVDWAGSQFTGAVIVAMPEASGSGPISVAPGFVAAALSALGPAVQLGALSLAPGSAAAALAPVGPAVQLGALSLAPGAAEGLLLAAGPAIQLGALSLAPGVAAASLAPAGPTLRLGSMAVSPGPAALSLSAHGPLIQLGALLLTPGPAPLALAALGADVRLGSALAAPGAVTLALAAHGPLVDLGALLLAPGDAALVLEPHGPAVQLGSMAVVPGHAVASLAALGPLVDLGGGGAAIVVGAADIALMAHGPDVQLGALALVPGRADLTLNAAGPGAIRLGSMDMEPGAAGVSLAAHGPLVGLGALALAPGDAALLATVHGPTGVVLGSLLLVPGAAPLSLIPHGPLVLVPPLALAPGAAALALTLDGPAVLVIRPATAGRIHRVGPDRRRFLIAHDLRRFIVNSSPVYRASPAVPGSLLDLGFDWTAWLAQSPGDAILSSSWTSPTGLALSLDSQVGAVTSVWAAPTTADVGTTHEIANSIQTVQGRRDTRTILLSIIRAR
jgi:hypothetical protein